MAKKRSKQKRRMPDAPESDAPADGKKKSSGDKEQSPQTIGQWFASKGVRETIESIAIAFILAFLFRTFEAEAFVIPTGSMAETLRGRHVDLPCEMCGYQHIGGASEKHTNNPRYGPVVATTCPMCRHVNRFAPNSDEEPYFTGDRIIVSKFVYDVSEPKRWDVIVFKYPFKASDNYIKRLIGLPNETLKISGGDIWVKPLNSNDEFTIARKPPEKITAMMQAVHDSDFRPEVLAKAGWPARWQPMESETSGSWDVEKTTVEDGNAEVSRRSFTVKKSSTNSPAWLRYHHYTPTEQDWADADEGEVVPPPERLVTDFYGYNAFINNNVHSVDDTYEESRDWKHADYESDEAYGLHWVGDLVLEAEVDITGNEGALLLDLVEGGRHYRCSINLVDGKATLSILDIDGNAEEFSDDTRQNASKTVSGNTGIGPGKHHLRMANVDNKITLWVDERVVEFDGPTTYLAPAQRMPDWNEEDAGDLAPAGIGSEGAEFTVHRMKIFRDIYYIAVKSPNEMLHSNQLVDYDRRFFSVRNGMSLTPRTVLDFPEETRDRHAQAFDTFFESRRSVEFDLQKDYFFTLGDNSPQSMDARIWDPKEHFVHRNYLIGKAMFIYWPHPTGPLWLPNPWDGGRMTFPIVPNVSRMGFVR